MRALPVAVAAALAAALGLAACSDPGTGAGGSASSPSGSSASAAASASFDPDSLSTVPAVAKLVPQAVKDRGELRNGADTSYAPAEFLASDGHTPVGYDVDLVQALAKIMGLEKGVTSTAEFPTIIPALGTKYDVGASSYTITADRLQQVHMVSYLSVGSSYAVAKGNPSGFDPDQPCGATIGVENGTTQLDYANALAKKCAAQGKAKLKVMPMDLQTDIATKVIGGQFDATLADTPVIGYTVEQAKGKLELVGKEFGAAAEGIAVAKSDGQLAKAVQAGLQYLMDKGYLKQMLTPYGAEEIALTTAEIDPNVTE